MNCKIRRNYDRNGPSRRNPFYFNIADFHLPRPRKKKKEEEGMVDGYPIIKVDI